MPKHYVYVLLSLRDRRFYVGLTSDVTERLKMHNAGLIRATKLRMPFELVYWEGCLDRSDAAQREKYLKTAWGKTLSKNPTAEISHAVKTAVMRQLRQWWVAH